MRRKILHVTQFLGVGGLEKILFILIKEQMKAGHHVDLAVYDVEQGWVEHFKANGINIISDYRKKEGYDINLLKRLDALILDYDIVHTHDLNPVMYIAPLKVLRKARGRNFPRHIHTSHGMDHIKKRPVTKLYERLCASITDLTVGVSPAVLNVYRNDLLLPPGKAVNINNGTNVDNEEFSRERSRNKIKAQFDLNNDHPILVYVARVVPLKNHHYIVEAVKDMADINVLFIGPSGDDEYFNTVKRSLPSHVKMAGSCSNINEILSASDFYISSSTHEGIPVAVLEAGAMKLPCLLSDIPGHRLMQNDAEYFPLDNVAALKNKITQLLLDQNRVEALSNGIYQRVKDKYSSKAMYESYMKAYEGTLC